MKNRKGITLVELMVVVGIIAVLLSMAIPNIINARKRASATRCLNNLKLLYESGQYYRLRESSSVSTINAQILFDAGYLETVPSCPIGGVYATWNVNSIPTCAIGSQGTPETWDDHVYEKQ